MLLPSALRDCLEAANRAGLEQVRSLMRRRSRTPDSSVPSMQATKDFNLPGPGGPIAARLYQPAGTEPRGPAIVYFHGGGFVIGSLETFDAPVRRLAAAAQTVIISVQYRLAPEAPWPSQQDDALAAIKWVIAQAEALEIDPSRIALCGDSAGAYLAVSTTGLLNAAALGTIAAQILIYPLLQIEDEAWKTTTFQDSRIVGRVAVAYIRSQCAARDHHVPPIEARDLPRAPPTLIATGGVLDPIRPDARAYAAYLRSAGVAVVTREYAALPHGFGSLGHVLPGSRAALAEIGNLAGQMLRV